jgi:hypothetical protein
MHEDYYNHPMDLVCNFNKKIFIIFKKIWFFWTQTNTFNRWWNELWISGKYQYKNQLFLAMCLLKRKIWINYTSTLYDEDKFALKETIIYKWLGSLEETICSIFQIISSNSKLLKIEKDLQYSK